MNQDFIPPAGDPQEEISALIRQLHETEERLRVLTEGKVDSVVHPSGASYLLHRAQGELLKSEASQREFSALQLAILDALPAHIALLDEKGVVVAVNDAWKGFGSNNVFDTPEYGIGRNYIHICEQAHGECAKEAHQVGEGIKAVLQGEARSFTLEYPCHSPTERRWFRVMATPLHKGGGSGAVIMHVNVSERKLAEEAVLKIEAEQQLLFKQLELERARLVAAQQVAKVGSWETNLDTMAVIWSAETYRVFETDPASFQPSHQSFLELVHPEDRAMVDEAFIRSLEKTDPCVIEHRLLLPGGRIKHVEERWQVFRDDAGKAVRALGTCQDITERKLAEGEIERQASFAAFNPNPVLELSAEGGVSYANAAAGSMATALKCEQVQQLLPPETSEIVRECLASGKPRLRLEQEQFGRVISWSFYPIPNRPVVHCYGGDITERKWVEERMSEQAALLDAAHEAILVKDLDDQIIYWNKGAERVYGWQAEEVLGRKSAELLYQDPRPLNEAYKALMLKDEWQGEVVKLTKDGRKVTMDVRWTLVRDGQGKPKSILAINVDVTEKKKMEAQFLRAQRMESIGTLAGGIAHDLNNVLAPILISAELLKEMVENEEAQGILETVQVSAQRGADLVRQVLTFARGVEGQRMDVNVSHQLKEIQKVVRETFPKNIKAIFQTGPELWPVTGDPTQLHQVFMNLLVNARDAMTQGGRLEVTTENVVLDEVYAGMNPDAKAGSFVVISVVDTGAGIPPEIRDRIFEPFFTTKEIGQGTGLGLSTVSAIVRSHGGFIHLYSEMGKGSRFKIYLPAKATDQMAEVAAIQQTQLPLGQGEWVLVVDDEENIREVAKKMLERHGYKVHLAAHGAEAVAVYVRHQAEVAVVLTDMAMPVMDGPTTIIALRSINPKLRIIGTSGHASNGGVAKALGAGIQHFIPKPYTAERVLRMLAEVLRGGEG